jgi:hypothetical protein
LRQRVAEDREIVQVRAPTAAEAIRARCRCIRRCSCNGASLVPARAGPGPPVLTCAAHRPRVARVWYLQLFDSRQHPLGGRPGVDDNSRELPFFEPRAVQLEAKLKHGARNPSCRRVAHMVPGDASQTPVCPHLPRPRFLAIWTGPQLWEKVTRKFISHHSRLTAKGFTDDEA